MADKPTLYLETTIPSYLTARPSRDVIVLAHQEITREWWERKASCYDIHVSELVYFEVQQGDRTAAQQRFASIGGYPVLQITDEARELAEVYVQKIPVSRGAAADALHLAIATLNEMEYLLTWNCRHIASGLVKRRLAEINSGGGFLSPTICTPEELLYENQGVD